MITEPTKEFSKLRDCALTIKNDEIREQTLKMLDEHTPEYFQHVPASSSGKYHPKYALGEGGLVRHTLAAFMFLEYLTQVSFWGTKEAADAGLGLTSDDIDRMKCAIILHDTRKAGDGDEENRAKYKNHEGQAADAFNEVAGVERSRIGDIISAHMGEWSFSHKPSNLPEILAHLADYLASRKAVTVDITVAEKQGR